MIFKKIRELINACQYKWNLLPRCGPDSIKGRMLVSDKHVGFIQHFWPVYLLCALNLFAVHGTLLQLRSVTLGNFWYFICYQLLRSLCCGEIVLREKVMSWSYRTYINAWIKAQRSECVNPCIQVQRATQRQYPAKTLLSNRAFLILLKLHRYNLRFFQLCFWNHLRFYWLCT